MKAKLLSLFIFFLFICPVGNSQKKPIPDAGLHFGLQGGLNLRTIFGDDYEGNDLNYKLKLGFNAGANVNVPIAPDLYLQPGLLFSLKGYTHEFVATTTVNLFYVEIPLNILFRPQAGDGHLLLGAGPYAGYGLFGNKITGNDNDKIKFKNTVSASDPAVEYFKPFDAGADVLFGYELYSGLYFIVEGQIGLLNIYPEYEGIINNKASRNNFGIGLSVGYRF